MTRPVVSTSFHLRALTLAVVAGVADVTVAVEGFGDVTVDISYGGAFYALVDARRFGLDVSQSRTRDLVAAASAVTKAVKSQVDIQDQRETCPSLHVVAALIDISRSALPGTTASSHQRGPGLHLRNHPDRRPGQVLT